MTHNKFQEVSLLAHPLPICKTERAKAKSDFSGKSNRLKYLPNSFSIQTCAKVVNYTPPSSLQKGVVIWHVAMAHPLSVFNFFFYKLHYILGFPQTMFRVISRTEGKWMTKTNNRFWYIEFARLKLQLHFWPQGWIR